MNAGIMAGDMIWHAIRRAISVMCVLVVIGGIGWAIYVTFFKPHTNPTKTTSQHAEEIVNNENMPKATFGCSSLRVINYYKNQKPKVKK